MLIDVQYNGQKVFTEERLFPIDGDANLIVDILPNIPYAYPTVGTKDNPRFLCCADDSKLADCGRVASDVFTSLW